jgi:hypothetical protein
MTTFEQIKNNFPPTIKVPIELEKLCNWADANAHEMGGYFELCADENGNCFDYWSNTKYLHGHFAQFGVGPSGAPTGIWRNDDGKEYIVYLYDEEAFGKIIAENLVDFMRILAIGYEDTNQSCDLTIQDYNKLCEATDLNKGHNPAFKAWVEQEFTTTVPLTGHEVYVANEIVFIEWFKRRVYERGVANLLNYKLFDYIGKDIRTLDIYATKLDSKLPRKLGKTLIVEKNWSGIRAVLNEDFTIRYLVLAMSDITNLSYFSDAKPAELNGSENRAQIEKLFGTPFKKGKKDHCDWVEYQIQSASNGLRTVTIFFHPNLALDKLGKIIIS